MMLFACLRMMGHGDDSPRDGNDNWMAIASLSSPAISSVLGDSYLLSLIIYLLNVTRDTEILSEIHKKDNILVKIYSLNRSFIRNSNSCNKNSYHDIALTAL